MTLFLLTLQIVLGIALIGAHLRAPSSHYLAAVLGWGGLMAAGALERRNNRNLTLSVTAISSLCVLIAFYLGMHAVNHGP